MKNRWLNIKGLDGDYEPALAKLHFDYKHYRLYEHLCEKCEAKLEPV